MKKLCIYHANCADGFAAAWVVRKAFGEENVEFHPGVYQETPPDVTGRDVILVDFSYKRDVIRDIMGKANSIVVIDHHKTAVEDLTPLATHIPRGQLNLCFDVSHSGAMLAWIFFFGDEEPPALIRHIEDRDLWRFSLPGTREIQAAVFSYPYDFQIWDRLMAMDVTTLQVEGEVIERKHFKDINELLVVGKRRMIIGGYNVPVCNLPYTMSSDAGHIMAKDEPFAACYMDQPNGRVFSLRSSKEGVDVSEIAKKYGGGGHRNAAGFKQVIGWEGE